MRFSSIVGDGVDQANRNGARVEGAADKHREEQLLRESNERFRGAFESSPLAKALFSVDGPEAGRVTELNRAFCGLFGVARDQMLGQVVPSQLGHPDDVEIGLADIGRLVRREIGSCHFEKRFMRAGTHPFVAGVWVSLVNGEASGGRFLLCHFQDVTERRAANAALRASEERYRHIVETTSEGVWTIDAGARTTFVNLRMAEMLGYEVGEMLGRPLSQFVMGPAPDIVAKLRSQPPGRVVQHESELRKRDGSPLWVSISSDSLPSDDGDYAGALAMVSDITERRREAEERERARQEAERLEAALHQAQKLETVGQLAGGVAHDFNNLLAVIMHSSEFALSTLEGHEAQEEVREIRAAAERAAALTRQLLVFSRQEVSQPRLLDLNALVSSVERLLRRTIQEHIDLEVALDESALVVHVDPSQLERVIVNLAVNGRDAMPEGGTLRVETSRVALEGASVRRHPGVVPGPYVRLAISDSGHGMTEEVRERVFEPFFTTKPQGMGTGLGLAVTYGIVKQHGGHVEISSQPGAGTVVEVYLPASGSDADVASHDQRPAARRGEGQRILVVEDEDGVRRITERILAGHGYDVLAVPGPGQALHLAAAEPVDLVLTDVVMPVMSGAALVARLRGQRPGLPAIFMSGYTDRPGVLPADALFLAKPFSRQQMLECVALALDDQAETT
jgi:PAS domain S-box-containing protein